MVAVNGLALWSCQPQPLTSQPRKQGNRALLEGKYILLTAERNNRATCSLVYSVIRRLLGESTTQKHVLSDASKTKRQARKVIEDFLART